MGRAVALRLCGLSARPFVHGAAGGTRYKSPRHDRARRRRRSSGSASRLRQLANSSPRRHRQDVDLLCPASRCGAGRPCDSIRSPRIGGADLGGEHLQIQRGQEYFPGPFTFGRHICRRAAVTRFQRLVTCSARTKCAVAVVSNHCPPDLILSRPGERACLRAPPGRWSFPSPAVWRIRRQDSFDHFHESDHFPEPL